MGISEAIKTLSRLEKKHRAISEAAEKMENNAIAKDNLKIADAIDTVLSFILSERR